MIVVRNVFKLKFGESKEAVSLWKQGLAIARDSQFSAGPPRILTDMVGQFYTLVMESTHESLGEYERAARNLMSSNDWQAWYAKVVPLLQGGYREVFRVVE